MENIAIILLAAAIVVAAFRGVSFTVRHEYHTMGSGVKEKPQSLEDMEQERATALTRAKRQIKPWFERRARGRQVAADQSDDQA